MFIVPLALSRITRNNSFVKESTKWFSNLYYENNNFNSAVKQDI